MSTVADHKRYRIVHLTSAHNATDVRIFHKECRSLARAGYEVVVVGNHACDEIVDGVRLRGLRRSGGRLKRMTLKLCGICWEAFRAKGDLYHIHDPELLLVGLILRATGRRVVYDVHEDLPKTVLFKAYLPTRIRKPLMWAVEHVENLFARHMSGLVAATPALADRFHRIHRNTVVVNNFVIVDEFVTSSARDWNERDLTVTYYGGFSEARGVREMLAAMDLLPSSLGARLELGGAFYESALQVQLMSTPQWKHVIWHGTIDRDGIATLLRRVRAGLVVLHPDKAYIASHPTKLFEYMAAGIPVIVSDFPLWRSIVLGAGCGLLVDPFDVQGIATAIEYLMTHDREAQAMGQRGRKAVEEHFNWENEAQTLLSFYSSLLCERTTSVVEPLVA